MNNIPEMSVEEFENPFLIDLRGISFIPTPMVFWMNQNLNFHEIRLLSYIDFKEHKIKGAGCLVSDQNLAMIMRTSEKTVKNMISSLINRGYIRKENSGLRNLFTIHKEN